MALTKEQLITKLGITHVESAEQDSILQQVADTVSTRILNKVSQQLTDADLQHLEPLLDADDDVAIEAFIRSKIPEYDIWRDQIETDTLDELANNNAAVDELVQSELQMHTKVD